MPQHLLHDLNINTRFAHPCCKRVPQNMAAKSRKQHRIHTFLFNDLIIAISDNSTKCFIQRSLMLTFTKTIDKNEIRISINRNSTFQFCFLLILSF